MAREVETLGKKEWWRLLRVVYIATYLLIFAITAGAFYGSWGNYQYRLGIGRDASFDFWFPTIAFLVLSVIVELTRSALLYIFDIRGSRGFWRHLLGA